MKFKIGHKNLTIKFKRRQQVNNNTKSDTESSDELTSEDQIYWSRILNGSDKLLGIYEIAKLSVGGTTFNDIELLLASIGIKVYRPLFVSGNKINLAGDIMCQSRYHDTKFYASVTMVKQSHVEADVLSKLCDEAKILNLNPVIIAPFGVDEMTAYMASNLGIEVIGTNEMEKIHQGIEDKASEKISLTNEILREVSNL